MRDDVLGRLLSDEASRPRVFSWRGPMAPDYLDTWASNGGIRLPVDLRALWLRTGGGDLFETETILSPMCTDPVEDVDTVTAEFRARGLPLGHLVVHTGLQTTAVRLSDGKWLSIDREGHPATLAEYDGFADWYARTVRAEYAERYGLPVDG